MSNSTKRTVAPECRAGAPGATGWRRPRGDRGAGTVLVLGIVATACVLISLIGMAGQAIAALHRARAAADLAALAGAAAASSARSGQGVGGCRVASLIAARNGGRLDACAADGAGAMTVRVRVPTGVHGVNAYAHARAGPDPNRPSPAKWYGNPPEMEDSPRKFLATHW